MIYTGDAQRAVGSPLGQTIDSGSVFGRVESLITNRQLRDRFLFGVPLYSCLPDPITRKRSEYTDAMLSDSIVRAINRIELHGGFAIQPVERKKRLPFDLAQYRQLGYFNVGDKPISAVLDLSVQPASSLAEIYRISPQWIEMGNAHRGQLNVIPYMPSTTLAYTPMSVTPTAGGGAAFLSILGSLSFIPAFWSLTYIAGWGEGQVPVVINDLIGMTAAIDVLSTIGATNRVQSYSVALDSASQTVATSGENVYGVRIKQLQDDRTALLSKLRAKLGFKLGMLGSI